MISDAVVLDRIDRIEGLLGRIARCLERAERESSGEPACPSCGSQDILDASTMGEAQKVCGGCGAKLIVEIVNEEGEVTHG